MTEIIWVAYLIIAVVCIGAMIWLTIDDFRALFHEKDKEDGS